MISTRQWFTGVLVIFFQQDAYEVQSCPVHVQSTDLEETDVQAKCHCKHRRISPSSIAQVSCKEFPPKKLNKLQTVVRHQSKLLFTKLWDLGQEHLPARKGSSSPLSKSRRLVHQKHSKLICSPARQCHSHLERRRQWIKRNLSHFWQRRRIETKQTAPYTVIRKWNQSQKW